MFDKKFKISNLTISKKSRAIIIAEIGINHEGSFSKCIDLINNANKSGADLIKIQTANPSSSYLKKTKSYKLFNKASLSKEETFNLFNYCKKKQIKLFSTFDRGNYEFFKKINQPCYKISSSLFYDFNLIQDVLKFNKPVLISTGVTDINDIDELIKILKNKKNKKVSLLHCVSLYPTKNEEINLSRISFIKNRYNIIAGFSDHTIGDEATVASVHYGAKILEKHFTLDDKVDGYDHKISLNPKKFFNMVKKVRENEKMIGESNYRVFNNLKYKKINEVIRSFRITKNQKKNNFINASFLELVRTNDKKKIIKFSVIVKKIFNKRLSRDVKSDEYLKLNLFKK